MADLVLSPEERAVLIEFLESGLSDLSFEIADTDRMEFRERLKHKRQLLRDVLDRLKAIGQADAR